MKILKGILVAVLCFGMSGCGMHEFKQGDPLISLEQSKEASKVACYQAQAAQKVDYTGLSEMAVAMLEMQKSNERMMSMVTGKSSDPCSGGTNLNDVLIADVKSRNETLGKFTDGFWGATKTVGALYFGYKTIDSIMSSKTGPTENFTFTGDNANIKGAFNKGNTKMFDVTGAEGMTTVSPIDTVTTPTNTNSLNTTTP